MNKDITLELEDMVKDGAFPGANCAIITSKYEYTLSVGYKSLLPNLEKNNINTLYDMASLTKVVVTNTIIGRMLDKKIIKLTDKVSMYLKRFKHKDITILDLLLHTSGLPADLKANFNLTKEEYIKDIYNLDLVYKTGSKVLYSDIGFIILGFMIEEIYQKTLDKVAYLEVFKPLGMNKSYFNPKDKEECAPTEVTTDRNVVRGVVHDEKAYLLGGVAGHAGLFSTLEDVITFSKMIVNDGYHNNERYLSKEIIDLWFHPFIEEDKNRYRTIGWIVGKKETATGDLGNINTMFHLGFTGCSIIINRDTKLISILLTNRVHPTRNNTKIYQCRPQFYKMCNDIEKKYMIGGI